MNATIDIVIDAGKWRRALPDAEALCRRFARAALAAPASAALAKRSSLRIALADDATIHDLNRTFRGIDKPTNVLSFPAHGDDTDAASDPDGLGDVMIALETTAREAKADGIALADHFAHLVIHGVLHLRGYDHQRAADAEVMETIESNLLTRFGIADPYAGTWVELRR